MTGVLAMAGAALALGVAAPAWAQVQCNVKQQNVDPGNTTVSCELGSPQEWHFVITQVAEGSCPQSLALSWANDGGACPTTVPVSKQSGGVCHYHVSQAECVSATLVNASYTAASACRNTGGIGRNSQFNVSHRPCAITSEVLAIVNAETPICDPAANTYGAGWELGIAADGEDPAERYAKVPSGPTDLCPVAADEDGPTDLTRLIGQAHLSEDVLPVAVQDKAYVAGASGSGWMKFYLYENDAECELHSKVDVTQTETVAITGSSVLATPFVITDLGRNNGQFGYVACLVSNDDTDLSNPAVDLVCGKCEDWPVEVGENQGGCETAFAKSAEASTCFLDIDGLHGNRWGWTNGPLAPGTYEFPLWAGAGQCDTGAGSLAGSVSINYDGSQAVITYNVTGGFNLHEIHAWAGSAQTPGTVAPGQYEKKGGCASDSSNSCTITGLSGDIHVIAHAVVGGSQCVPSN